MRLISTLMARPPKVFEKESSITLNLIFEVTHMHCGEYESDHALIDL